MISFSCSQCARAMNVQETLAGRTIMCPGCKASIQVPAFSSPPAPAVSDQLPLKSIHGMAVASLVLGIIGLSTFCLCGIGALPALIALILGIVALSHAKKPDYSREGSGMAVAGTICGGLSMVLAIGVAAWWGFALPWTINKSVEDIKKHAEEWSRPDSLQDAEVEYSRGQITIECSVKHGSMSLQTPGTLKVEVYNWGEDDPLSGTDVDSLTAQFRIAEKEFPITASDYENPNHTWKLKKSIRLSPPPKRKYLTAKLTFTPSDGSKSFVRVASEVTLP